MREKIEKLKQKQGGFTLVELMVTIIILGLVLLITVQLSNSFFHRYRMIEARWKAQNAALHVMQYFELRSEALNNSATISLFRTEQDQPPVKPAKHDPKLPLSVMQGVPDEGNDTYAYIYAQSPNPGDPNQGKLIYVLERGAGQKPVSLTQYLMKEDIPLDISFHISTAPVAVQKEGTDTRPSYVYDGGEDTYLRATVDVLITTPQSIGGNYQLKTSFTMNNMAKNQMANFEGDGDITPTAGDIGIAGWTNQKLNDKGLCPVDANIYPSAQQPANILRYVSTKSFLESQNVNGAGVDLQGAGLCFGKLSMRGSKFEAQAVGALHDFRDNVLAKTELGNQIIDAYYNTWSPALVNMAAEHPALLKVGKCVLLPVSFVAMLAAD